MRPLYTQIFFAQVFITRIKYQVSSDIALPRGHGYFLARKFLVLGRAALPSSPGKTMSESTFLINQKAPAGLLKFLSVSEPGTPGKAAKISIMLRGLGLEFPRGTTPPRERSDR